MVTIVIANIYRRVKKIIEFFQGVDFIDNVSVEGAGIDSTIGNRYDVSNIKVLRSVLDKCDITSNDIFLDYGCGKGAVLALASRYSFSRVIGVELSEKLVDIAETNLNNLRLKNVEIICQDAREYRHIDSVTFFYFFNPFPESVFEVVMGNIKDSYMRYKRKITIIYYNPICSKSIIETGIFIKSQEIFQKNMCASMDIYVTKED